MTDQPWAAPGTGWPQQPAYGMPRRTESLAIASLVLGCSLFIIWPLALFLAIAAVITGHMARKRIRTSGDLGAGMALAGLILGYIGIALSILAIIGISILIFAVGPAVTQDDVVKDAKELSYEISGETPLAMSPRDAEVIQRTYLHMRDPDYGCCDDDDITLADGTPLLTATDADYERNNWQLQLTRQFIWDQHACLTVPANRIHTPQVTEGPCP